MTHIHHESLTKKTINRLANNLTGSYKRGINRRKNTCVVFPLVLVDIDVEIKLSTETFTEELENKSSTEYKELEEEVHEEVMVHLFFHIVFLFACKCVFFAPFKLNSRKCTIFLLFSCTNSSKTHQVFLE